MKVFISQPMRGLTDEVIKLNRDACLEKFNHYCDKNFVRTENSPEDPIELIDSFLKDFDANDNPVKYLAESIRLLADADWVIFDKNWEQARGCMIEHEVAVRYGIPCFYCN